MEIDGIESFLIIHVDAPGFLERNSRRFQV